jgi:hypothetical protein
MLRGAIAHAALALGAIAAAVGTAELGFRRVRSDPATVVGRGLFAPDPELGFRLRAGVAEHGVPVTNAHGLRGAEFPRRKPTGEIRVLALGDSFTFGMGAAEDPWPARLQRRLGRSGVRVVNAGVPGWGTDQALSFLRRDGFGFEPDLVALAFFVGNDVTDNCARGEHVCLGGEIVELASSERFRGPAGRLRLRARLLLDRSYLFRWLDSRRLPRDEAASPPAADAFHRYQAGRVRILAPSWADGAGRACWDNTRSYLREMHALCRARGNPFLVVVIPDSLQVDDSVLDGALRFTAYRREELDRDLPQERLARICAEAGLDCLDLLPAVRASARPPYLPNDSHFDPEGDVLIVDALAARIRERRLLDRVLEARAAPPSVVR